MLRALLVLGILALAAGGVWALLRPHESAEVVADDGVGLPRPSGQGLPTPIGLARAPQEAIEEEGERLPEPAVPVDQARRIKVETADDQTAT